MRGKGEVRESRKALEIWNAQLTKVRGFSPLKFRETAKYWLYFLRGYPTRANPVQLPRTIEK